MTEIKKLPLTNNLTNTNLQTQQIRLPDKKGKTSPSKEAQAMAAQFAKPRSSEQVATTNVYRELASLMLKDSGNAKKFFKNNIDAVTMAIDYQSDLNLEKELDGLALQAELENNRPARQNKSTKKSERMPAINRNSNPRKEAWRLKLAYNQCSTITDLNVAKNALETVKRELDASQLNRTDFKETDLESCVDKSAVNAVKYLRAKLKYEEYLAKHKRGEGAKPTSPISNAFDQAAIAIISTGKRALEL